MNMPVIKTSCLTIVLAAMIMSSCTQEVFTQGDLPIYKGEAVESTLTLSPASIQVIGMPMSTDGSQGAQQTRSVQEPDALEKRVNDIWVFQFDENGTQIAAPQFYTVNMQGNDIQPVKLMLHAYKKSQLYVVANTNDKAWAQDKLTLTATQLDAQTITFTSEQDVYGGDKQNLPMTAWIKDVTINAGAQNNTVNIPLKSLLAKICFSYTIDESLNNELNITDVRLYNIPNLVQLGDATAPYPQKITSLTYAGISSPAAGNTYTWYIPQNLQGIKDNQDASKKNEFAPQNAFYIRMFVDSDRDGSNYAYTIYPGKNTTNDFNLEKGYCYNITVKINSEKTDDRVLASPANCFVMKEGASLVFDPYNRPETGGGWIYSDYVNKDVASKRIDHVDILWQTKYNGKLAIGDNSNKDLVHLEGGNRVIVNTNGEGNAVIAAYNSENIILWSWHIWVNNSSPGQKSKAVLYKTYKWDATNIYGEESGEPRVDGYPFMSCNLGALNNESGDPLSAGLLYQWGRKDPFPQAKDYSDNTFRSYTNANGIIEVYDANGNQIPITSTAGIEGQLFNAVITDSQKGTIDYTLQNPTTFIAAAKTIDMFANGNNGTGNGTKSNYINNGGWYWVENENYTESDRLWGGEPFGTEGQTILTINDNQILADNGAKPENKSIFDPCPAGWILPAADAWLGFTIDGLNHSGNVNQLNYTTTPTIGTMQLHTQAWKDGPELNFPLQGWRMADGCITRTLGCGAYFTSAASPGGNAYIFHIHSGFVYPYDLGTYGYSRRANAAPIRCVRTSK